MTLMQAVAAAALVLALAACGGRSDEPAAAAATQAVPERKQALSATRPLTTGELLNWAESQYPELFPGHQDDVTLPPYVYRHYPSTGNYLGVANGRVLVLGPVSGGQELDVGTVTGFRCQVLPLECQANPLASARWSTGLLLEADAEARALAALGIDDDGQATAVVTDQGSLSRLWVTRSQPADASGVRRWSTPQPLDAVANAAGGYATSEPVLLVAANGTTVVLWESGGYLMASRRLSTSATWSTAARLVDTPGYAIIAGTVDFPTRLQMRPVIDPAGNVALLFAKTGSSEDPVRQVVHWAAGADRATVRDLPTQTASFAMLGVAGSTLILATELSRSGGLADLVVWRGTAAAGFGSGEVLDRHASSVALKNLLVGPTGRVLVVWNQNDGSRDTTFVANASSPTGPYFVSDEGPGFDNKRLVLTDLGDLHSWGYQLVEGRCEFRRQVGGAWLPAIQVEPCAAWQRAWTSNSHGDLLGVDADGRFSAFDSRTGRTRAMSYVTIVPMRGALDIRVALSKNGKAVFAATAPYTQLPSPSQPNGITGGVNQVWGWLLP